MNSKLYMVTVNDKKFDEWCKAMKKKLKKMNPIALDHFNQGYNDVARGNYLARASFICYWEIFSNGSLSKLAPAITQATMIHLFHRFIEQEQAQEAELVQHMMTNFLRLLQVLEQGAKNEEE